MPDIINKKEKKSLTQFIFPFIFSLALIIPINIWILFNNNLIAFDSVRYYTHICEFRNSFQFPLNIDFIIHSIKATNSLWELLLLILTFPFMPLKIQSFILINNILFISLFTFIYFNFLRKFFCEKVSCLSILIVFLNPSFFNNTKILMPELFSWSLLILSWNSLYNAYKGKSFNHFLKYCFFSVLIIFTNLSDLIYALIPSLIFISKYSTRKIFISYLSALIFILLILTYAKHYLILFQSPDLSGNWMSLGKLNHMNFIKSFIWQLIGFINKTAGGFYFILTLGFFMFSFKKFKKYSIFSLIIFFSTLLLISLLRPTIARDFYVTGYRYQIPLIFIFAPLTAYGILNSKLIIKIIFYFIFLPLLLIQLIFQSCSEEKAFNFRFSIKIIPFEKIKSSLDWDGYINFFDCSNQIISGGGKSKFYSSQAPNLKVSEDVLYSIKSNLQEINTQSLWITSISKSEEFNHCLILMIKENANNWQIQADQKNPYYSCSVQNSLRNMQKEIPKYKFSKNGEIFLKESDFIILHENSDEPEPELKTIHKHLLNEFNAIKDFYKLIDTLTIPGNVFKIYKRILSNEKTIYNSAFNSMHIKDTIDFCLIKPNDTNSSFNEFIHENLTPLLAKQSLKFSIIDTFELNNAFEKNNYKTIIFPPYFCFSKDIITNISLHYQKGINIFFLGPICNNTKDFNSGICDNCKLMLKTLEMSCYGVEADENYILTKTNNNNRVRLLKDDKFYQGLLVSSGLKTVKRLPTEGNVFPFRVPCSNQFPILELNNSLAFPVIFYNFFRNPYDFPETSRIFFSSIDISSSKDLFNDKFMEDIIKNFNFPLDLINAYPNQLILTSENEDNISISVTLKNKTSHSIDENIKISISNESDLIDTITSHFKIKGKETIKEIILLPSALLKSDITHFKIEFNDSIFQSVKCAVIRETSNKTLAPGIIISDKKLKINNKIFSIGMNYYPSSNYDRMWLEPNLNEIINDFKTMKNNNADIIRCHFIHHNWYKDYNSIYLSGKLGTLNNRYDELDVIVALLEIAKSLGINICLDIFSLVGLDMGSPEGWTGDMKRFENQTLTTNQDLFLIKLMNRINGYKNFTLDLINEPQINSSYKSIFLDWVKNKVAIIKSISPDTLVTIGMDQPFEVPFIDYYSLHTDTIQKYPATDKPYIIQEFWPISPLNKADNEIQNIENVTNKAIKLGYGSLMFWAFASPANLYRSEGLDERWEKSLGIFKREDDSFVIDNLEQIHTSSKKD